MAKKIKDLSIQFVPFVEVENLSPGERVKKLLDTILDNKIVILQGKLAFEEEARLIEDTMAMVGHVKGFKGVELAVVEPDKTEIPFVSKLRHSIANFLVKNQDVLTIIGPASVVKEIKRDPKKIEVLFKK